MMRKVTFLLGLVLIALSAASVSAQYGGKAEPNRVRFAKGKSSATLTGSLKGDEEYEFVFGAKKGQTVYITNSDSNNFAYRVFVPENEDVNYDSTDLAVPTLEFVVPETGDYMLTVRRNTDSKVAKRFSITLAIE